MLFYVFDSEQDANAVLELIASNVRAWLRQHSPDALSADGNGVRGRNAATGGLTDVVTQRWAVPELTSGGKWVFAVPTQRQTSPIPVSAFTSGIEAPTAEYDPAWFPSPPWPPAE